MSKVLGVLVVLALAGAGVYYYVQRHGNPMAAVTENPFRVAEGKYTASKYDEAVTGFRAALKADPNNELAPNAWFLTGKSLEELNKPQEALDAYREFEKKYPSHHLMDQVRRRIETLSNSGYK